MNHRLAEIVIGSGEYPYTLLFEPTETNDRKTKSKRGAEAVKVRAKKVILSMSLARQKCNAVVFVMSNQAYAIEQAFVDLNAFSPEGKFAPFDLLPAWDYLALAKAFGANGYRAETRKDLRTVLAKVKDLENIPALVDVVIPQKDLAPQLARLAKTPVESRKYGRAAISAERSTRTS